MSFSLYFFIFFSSNIVLELCLTFSNKISKLGLFGPHKFLKAQSPLATMTSHSIQLTSIYSLWWTLSKFSFSSMLLATPTRLGIDVFLAVYNVLIKTHTHLHMFFSYIILSSFLFGDAFLPFMVEFLRARLWLIASISISFLFGQAFLHLWLNILDHVYD